MLALDGGGARGMVSIGFLEEIETVLRKRHGRSDYVLSDYFDMIGGTSVGSILATMLALGWPMKKVRAEFERLCPIIFGKRRAITGYIWPKFSDGPLRKSLAETLGDMRLDSEEFKTGLAIITKRLDTGSAWVVYNNPNSIFWTGNDTGVFGNSEYRVVNLILASTAAPTYFPTHWIQIQKPSDDDPGKGLFVDGGLSPYNNPSLLMFMMAGIGGYRLGGVTTVQNTDGDVEQRGVPWKLGADNLFIVSVGTGDFRAKIKSPGRMAAKLGGRALLGMMADSQEMTLQMMHWLANPKRRWTINSEVGDLRWDSLGELIGTSKSMLMFMRYNIVLENKWLEKELNGTQFPEDRLEELQRLDNPKEMKAYDQMACDAAKLQVTADDFPWQFNRPKHGGTMFEIVRVGSSPGLPRLLAPTGLVKGDFEKIAKELAVKPFRAKKTGFVAAREATVEERIETRWDGKETEKTAKPGDFIVTNLTHKKAVLRDSEGHPNTYVIGRGKFGELYERDKGENEFGKIYRAIGSVDAIYFPGGFDILAPWGESQIAASGYLLRNGNEMYGNNKDTFKETYKES
jgi:hypothetical protein